MDQSPQLSPVVRRVATVSLIVLLMLFGLLINSADAQSGEPQVSVGIGGVAKLGHWVPVRFSVAASELDGKSPATFRVTVLDGDDTPASIVGPVVTCKDGFQGVMQFGRTYGDAKFELLDADGNSLVEFNSVIRKTNNDFMELVASTGRLIACLEPEPAEGNRSFAAQFDAALPGGLQEDDRIVSIATLDDLPRTAIALESCDSLVLLANDRAWIDGVSTEAVQSVATWVRNGGHIVIAAGPDQGSLFQEAGILQSFAPGTIGGVAEVESSRRLEEFCSSKEPYLARGETMRVLQIDNIVGRVELGQGETPLVVRSPLGLGEVTFVTFDPTDEKFLDWKSSSRFAQSLMKLRIGDASQSESDVRGGSAVRHSGYSDLVGQMKVPLERFTSLLFIPFVLIAALIALYILCIGVGDWFLVGRLFKKHELTWITFPLIAAGFCAIAWYGASASRPSTIQINQVELVDIDSKSGHVRATAWVNLYSPRGRTIDVSFGASEKSSEFGLQAETSRVTWLGLPGDGLGGMMNRANPGLYRTGYQQELSASSENAADLNVDMNGVELQVSSTRPLLAQWNGKFRSESDSRLQFSDQLEGTFANPFDVPLRDCKLFYNDLVYIIRSGGTLKAGDDVDIQSETTEKTVRSFLTRRSRSADDKNKSQSVPWDSGDIRIKRIMDMMMFYHGSGGQSYTGLTHSYHDFIEMTPNASMGQAILVGQLKDRASTLEIDGEQADDFYDSSLTIVRVLLPVENINKKRKR